MIIKSEAIKLLAIFNSSCKTFLPKKVDNLKYLYECAASGRDYSFSEFKSGFPKNPMTALLLEHFAGTVNAEKIDTELVLKFFGGIDHIKFTLDQISDYEKSIKKLSRTDRDSYLFAHQLTPIKLTRKWPRASGKYLLAGRKVHVRGLIPHPLMFPDSYNALTIGGEYLVHYATIIAPAGDGISSWIRNEQIKSNEFLGAMTRLEYIDYKIFMNLTNWTRKLLKECGF